MAYYVIHIQDIRESGLDIDGSTSELPWLATLLKDAVPEAASVEAKISAKVVKIDSSIEMIGGLYIWLDVACDRCLKSFKFEQQLPFRVILLPSPPKAEDAVDEEEAPADMSESLDFSFYSGEDVDVGDIIRQHVVMAQPISHVCNELCKGLCPHCGKDLNEGACNCAEDHSKSPFSVLKAIKVKKQ